MVEAGPPAELLARGGKYAELWARQQAHVDEVYDSSSEELGEAAEVAGAAASAAGSSSAATAAAPAAAAAAAAAAEPHASVRRHAGSGTELGADGQVSSAARGGAGLGGDLPSGTS